MKKITLLCIAFIAFAFSFQANAQCDYTLEMNDSWGDGWTGGTVDVLVNGAVVLDEATLNSGYQGTLTFAVNDGDDVTVMHSMDGTFPGDMSYRILNPLGIVVGTGDPLNDILTGTITAACPTCTLALTDGGMVVKDCASNQFSIDVDVTLIGDATSITDGTTPQTITTTGIYTFGPYLSGDSVTISLVHSDAACNFDLEAMGGICGPSETSCGAYSSTPGSFITTGSPVNDIITVTGTSTQEILDLNVIIAIDHTFLADLDISLTSPTGTVVDLMFDQCTSNENMDIEFDDEGVAIDCGSEPTIGVFTVTNASGTLLSDFDTETFDGDWTLTVVDDASGDDGTLLQWCLVPTLQTLGIEEVTRISFSYYPNPVNNTLALKAQKDIENVSVYNMLGQEVLRTAPNAVNTEVNMSALQSGAYFVKVTIGSATETVRIMKN
ncbi:T9SS type A sorting domain-containing protein [Lacinutrix sp. WUR7]|uniref:T9SS type A sorting domain-containing protein n=1 Tax=Lacinutrix sp. WUR7 TaxID=2653681 RepID=UPI00193DC6A0|nr:T9SS type A sorting domain-containing protein [Lacinutrix sp. WUR7]QRM90901.1 T9SS type A sorting domain-containing protein [Lacinutrix sp. WUR7]